MSTTDGLERLQGLVRRLRGPDGCPWDRAQKLEDLRPYLLEEAHEAAAAIDGGEWPEIAAELGDLLYLVAFVSGLAEEERAFTVQDVAEGIAEKMIARHPHVFGDEELEDAEAVHRHWEEHKARTERPNGSVLEGVPESLPALVAAYRITQKAAGVGFDWRAPAEVLDKVDEEVEELREALAEQAGSGPATREELGDLLFTVANLARHLEIDPEAALAGANRKFKERFTAMEQRLAEAGSSLADAPREELERLWHEAKCS